MSERIGFEVGRERIWSVKVGQETECRVGEWDKRECWVRVERECG